MSNTGKKTKKHNQPKSMRCSKMSSKRKIYNKTILHQDTTKTLQRQPDFAPKTIGKRRATTTRVKSIEGKKL